MNNNLKHTNAACLQEYIDYQDKIINKTCHPANKIDENTRVCI